jgi:hypothetical protein
MAAHNLTGRHVACLQAGSAEAADGDARRGDRIVGVERRDARDVGALLAHRLDAAEDDVVDRRGIEAVAVAQRALEYVAARWMGVAWFSAAALLALAARCAQGVVDIGFGHCIHLKAPADEFFHDFVGAAVDALHACVGPGPGDRVFPHVAVAAVQLHTFVHAP